MYTFICSNNKEVSQRLVDILSAASSSAKIYTSIKDLTIALTKSAMVNLIYHISDERDTVNEIELEKLQKHFKDKINTLVLSNTPNSEQGVRLLNMNVRGYANSWIEPQKLLLALSTIEQGEIWAGAVLIEYLLSKSTEQNKTSHSDQSIEALLFEQLTEREQQITQHIFSGQQNKLIADELFISERTVKAHLTTIYKKLDVKNRLELTLKLNKKIH